MSNVRVLIIDAGNTIPTFIRRRLTALVKGKVSVVLVTGYGQYIQDGIANKVIKVGGALSFLDQIERIGFAFFHPSVFIKMLSLKPSLKFLHRIKWALKFLPLACVQNVSIVHFQWIAHAANFEWLRQFHQCAFIGSARGSQLTIYPLTRPHYRKLIEESIRILDGIHCVSSSMAKHCEAIGVLPEKIFVNYNGIDLKKFAPKTIREPKKKFTIISVGSLIWRKGYLYQLEILNGLVNGGYDVELIWVGEGQDKEGLFYTAHILKLIDRVIFTGKIDESELPHWFSKADIYLSTSIAEGLSNSTVEAASCGLPLVAFACEGMDEVLEYGVTGFILPFGEVDGMIKKISYLIEHPEERMKMGILSRRRMVDRFDEDKWVSHMIKTYQSFERE